MSNTCIYNSEFQNRKIKTKIIKLSCETLYNITEMKTSLDLSSP
jgi:hypothetical protein